MSVPPDQSKHLDSPQEPGAPPDLRVLHYRTPYVEQRRTSSGWQIAGGFAIYQAAIWLRVFTFPNQVPVWRSLMEWMAMTVILVGGSLWVGVRWKRWGYFKGMLAALLLTGSCCGLLYQACGNPFGQ
ncbi:MAG TPA: hypothetical protein VGG19_15165 [Tepidisphaeraceae bacterium]|jgi:hypothetical protein